MKTRKHYKNRETKRLRALARKSGVADFGSPTAVVARLVEAGVAIPPFQYLNIDISFDAGVGISFEAAEREAQGFIH